MSAARDHVPGTIPAELTAALRARGATVEHGWREGPRGYLRASSPAGPLFARYSEDAADRPRLMHEAAVRAALGESGPLRAPAVFEQGPGWLVERRIETEPLCGPVAVDAALAALGELAVRDLPASLPTGNPGLQARLARRRRLARRLRLTRSALSVRDLLRARQLLASSPLLPVASHGDFHAGNVLFADGATWIVDWELSGRRPLGYDAMMLWPTLADEADRERLLAGALELVSPRHRDALLDLRYALVVRMTAGLLAADAPLDRDPAAARAWLARLPELRR